MKHKIIIIICLFSIAYSIVPGSVIYFEYQKEKNGSKQESASVYHVPYIGSYIFVNEPIIQNIKMISESLLYYYPQKNIALIMNNPDALISTTPVQLFTNTGSEDQGLGDMGFSLKEYELKRDTLIKTWELKGKKKKEYIRIDVFSKDQEIIKTRSYNNDNSMIKEVNFRNWIKINNYAYPLEIEILENNDTNKYTFWGIKELDALPDSLMNKFSLPENCDIHEYTF